MDADFGRFMIAKKHIKHDELRHLLPDPNADSSFKFLHFFHVTW